MIFRLIGAAIVLVGIFLVLQPFLTALLVAGVLAIATWPLYRRIHSLGGNPTLAAALMMLAILVLVVIPITLLAGAAADQFPAVANVAKGWLPAGVKVPEELRNIPVIGDRIYEEIESLLAR